ncbi:MAG: sugar phosphate isomerase/epimerase [Thermoleophilia bacterium]|nr:sugar phosphate isomerase/epimerase [Thermoleophilia bacterium]
MSANYVARQTGWAMHGWGDGDRTTNEHFRPLETYAERFEELLLDVRRLGFDALDVWGGHLNAIWATPEHLSIARELLDRHDLAVASYAYGLGSSAERIESACAVASALGTNVVGGPGEPDPGVLVPILKKHGLRFGIENHPEKTPAELLAKIGDGGDGTIGATVDTGWWGTQGYDAARTIEELADRLVHVHLKDVLPGAEHVTCRWGEGCVPIEECVRVLVDLGYQGAISVEHEPETYDPSEDCRAMREQLEAWLR